MIRYCIPLLLLLSAPTIASPYRYPRLVDTDTSCKPAPNEKQSAKESVAIYPGCSSDKDVVAVDLNSDDQCEFFVTWEWGRRCTDLTTIVKSDHGTMHTIGEYQGDAIDAFSAKRNGYYRLINYTFGGPRTNIIYTTHVLYFNGQKYQCEFCEDNSHGGYMDLGKKAYDKGDYALAEIYYWNAYAVNGERKLSDANNLSLTYIKLGKYDEAIQLLEKHLSYSDQKLKDMETKPCYDGGCYLGDKALQRLKSAALFNKQLAKKLVGKNTR